MTNESSIPAADIATLEELGKIAEVLRSLGTESDLAKEAVDECLALVGARALGVMKANQDMSPKR